MRSTMLVKHFSQFPTDPNYSELYSRMVVERVEDAIVTTYYSRLGNRYNRVIKIPLV